MNLEELAKIIKTKNTKENLIRELRLLSNLVNDINLPQDKLQHTYPILSTVMKTLNNQMDIQLDRNMLSQIDSALKNLDEVTVTVNETFVQEVSGLHEWVSKNISQHALIDYAHSADIIGGFRIIYRGRYKDFSLNKTIKEKVSAKKDGYD